LEFKNNKKEEEGMAYPRLNQRVKAIITWGRSKLNGMHIGKIISKPFRARSGAVLAYMDCEVCGKKHCIPWTSDTRIIRFEVLED